MCVTIKAHVLFNSSLIIIVVVVIIIGFGINIVFINKKACDEQERSKIECGLEIANDEESVVRHGNTIQQRLFFLIVVCMSLSRFFFERFRLDGNNIAFFRFVRLNHFYSAANYRLHCDCNESE